MADTRGRACSIASDTATNHGVSNIDVRVGMFTGTALKVFYLLDFPLRERHTGQHMRNVVSSLLFHMSVAEWNKEVVSISTDGDASMVGHVSEQSPVFNDRCHRLSIQCGVEHLNPT